MEHLVVQATEFYIQTNADRNHTQEYDLLEANTPIFRRGCSFNFALYFDRNYEIDQDVVRVVFHFGDKPSLVRGTKIPLLLAPGKEHKHDENQWGLSIDRDDRNKWLVLKVHIPPNVPVGIWKFNVETHTKNRRENSNVFEGKEDIYILFNPWCPLDGVYMENEEDRNEYVLNETGKIWCGGFKNPAGKHWIFGQFDDLVLPAAVYLISEKSGLSPENLASPILITRAISAVVNSADDNGLLVGKWDGDYSDGTSPHAWTGSTAILQQFLKNNGASVCYGQCWVFSAVTVTICRALGIPCRSVTNYVSAHDTNCTLTIDKFFDKEGNPIKDNSEVDSNDSCWNFHVWNDVWMSRPDLPPGYGGWQVIDATPQEQSENMYKCGPASMEAIRRGEVGFLYDTPFVFSEVNADVVHFKEDDESDWGFSKMALDKYHVGKKIITKKPGPTDDEGDSDLWDITHQYKNKEGSDAERQAVYNAIKGVPRAQFFYDVPNKGDVFFDLVDIDAITFGENFAVVVNIENNSSEDRTITAILSSTSIYYTGSVANSIKKAKGTFTLKAGQKEVVRLRVNPEEYMDKLVDHSLIKIYAIATVAETKQSWSEEDDFTLIKPEMRLGVANRAAVKRECEIILSFTNPLNMHLTRCSYTIEGPGLQKPKTVVFRDVQPKENVTIFEKFTPVRSGVRKIVANFTSQQIQGISGLCTVTVET